MKLHFTKMHGLGNDFVLIDATQKEIHLTGDDIKFLCNRHIGVGCDQLLLVREPTPKNYYYEIFNSDASEAEQCGNGARCVALYLREQGLWTSESISLQCLAGVMIVQCIKHNIFRVNMGAPKSIQLKDDLTLVSMGNPHVISFVNDLENLNLEMETEHIKETLKIKDGINASFVKMINADFVEARIFERGAGETLACGSGACAIAATLKKRGLIDKKVTVKLPGGVLTIECDGETVFMTGPAERVFDGVF